MNCPRPAPYSYHIFAMHRVGIYVGATGMVAAFGTFSNIINIIVFYRQGILSSSSTMNLTGLAVSYFISCVLTVFGAVCFIVMNFFVTDPFVTTAYSLSIVLSSRPLEITIQTTCWITAFTAFERVFCVVFPFKVKTIFTPKRSLAVLIAIFVGTVILCFPALLEYYLIWKIDPKNNATYLANTNSGPVSPTLTSVYIYTNTFAFRFMAIFIVAFCNVVLFWKVGLSQKFRNIAGSSKSVTDSKEPRAPTKETRLLKMITVVSVVFTVCYSVYVCFNIMFWIVWEICADYHLYEMYLAWDISNFFQIVNSSTNIFIYYTMSSRFKQEFNGLLMVTRQRKS